MAQEVAHTSVTNEKEFLFCMMMGRHRGLGCGHPECDTAAFFSRGEWSTAWAGH